MSYRLSSHSICQYSIRTGVRPFEALPMLVADLASSSPVSLQDACRMFSITHKLAGDTYRLWYLDRIGEHVLAIVRRDRTVATILTERMLGHKPVLRPRLMASHGGVRHEDGWHTRHRDACAPFGSGR